MDLLGFENDSIKLINYQTKFRLIQIVHFQIP